MLAHMKGREGNLLTGTQIKRLRIHCVSLSLTLFPLGGADLTDRFYLRNLSFGRPTIIMGPVFDMVAISHGVEGPIC
jgi:hypothetical protein